MPIFIPTAAPAPNAPVHGAADEERWRMFVRASLMGRPGAESSAPEAYRRIFGGIGA
jgi:hypothetical protein